MKSQTNPKHSPISEASANLAQPLNVIANAPTGGTDVKISKRSIFRMLGGTLTLLCAAQMFVACQPNSGGRGSPTADAPVLGGAGTGDTAGGDGVNNKIFEAHAVEVTKTPEWTNHIAPIEAHLASLSKLEVDDHFLAKFVRRKTWFIAPVALEQIEKKNLGVEFIRDPIQQIALQDDKSVWIDKTIYYADTKEVCTSSAPIKCNRVDTTPTAERDRATTLAHEAFVFLYTLKFMSWKEMCYAVGGEPKDCERTDYPKMFQEHEPKRKLNADDYKSIRAVTAWFMDQAMSSKNKNDLTAELIRNGFDTRLFNPESNPEVPENADARKNMGEMVDVDAVALYKSLADAYTLKRMPQTCVRIPLDSQTTECSARIDLVEVKGSSYFLKMSFALSINGSAQLFTAYRIIGPTELPTKLFRTERALTTNGAALWTTIGPAMPAGKVLEVGQNFYQVNVGLSEDKQTIVDIVLTPQRITKAIATTQSEYRGYIGEEFEIEYGSPGDAESKRVIFSDPEQLKAARNMMGYSTAGGVSKMKYVLNPRLGILPKK